MRPICDKVMVICAPLEMMGVRLRSVYATVFQTIGFGIGRDGKPASGGAEGSAAVKGSNCAEEGGMG